MLVWGKDLVRSRWMHMFGSHTDLFGGVGQRGQDDLSLTGHQRGEMALAVLLGELRARNGPAENNEFGFLGRIDFEHLQAIVVKTARLRDPRVAFRRQSKLATRIRNLLRIQLSTQAHRINPKRARHGSRVYSVNPGDTTTVYEAYAEAFGGDLRTKFFALPKPTLRSTLPGLLDSKGF